MACSFPSYTVANKKITRSTQRSANLREGSSLSGQDLPLREQYCILSIFILLYLFFEMYFKMFVIQVKSYKCSRCLF